jgi:cell division septum initiation protein DivIVA
VKKKWLVLAPCAALAVVATLVSLGVEDARQADLLEIQRLQAASRALRAEARQERLARDGATEEEFRQPVQEADEAWADVERLSREQLRRRNTWHARLLSEVRRRTGW